MRHVLLFSGGLDSYIAYHYIKEKYGVQPTLLYCALGHRYEKQELAAISYLTQKGIIPPVIHDFSFNLRLWEEADATIPMRNSLLAHVAALYGDKIWLIVQKGETNIPDRTQPFFHHLSEHLSYLQGREIQVDSPFWRMTKVDMVGWYRTNELDMEGLHATSSCYDPQLINGSFIACGQCSACFRRFVSFELNDLGEPYAVAPWNSLMARNYLKKAKAGNYKDGGRDEEILKALARRGITLDE